MILEKVYQIGLILNQYYRREPLDILSRYGGKGTWALVTGASDGIGKEFSAQLASLGFNIVLVSRTRSKLEDAEKMCLKLNSEIKTRIVQRDFCRSTSMEFYKQIIAEVSDIKQNIGLVVLNAGLMSVDELDNQEGAVWQNLLDTNVYHVAALAKQVIPILNARKKSALIVNSSIAGSMNNLPFYAVYSATKSFVDYLTKGLIEEYPDLDIQLLKPSFTSTNMIAGFWLPGTITTAYECVFGSLRDLGQLSITSASIQASMHQALGCFATRNLFSSLFRAIMYPVSKEQMRKI